MKRNEKKRKETKRAQDEEFIRRPSLCVPGMAQVLRVKVPSRVFTAKCSEPQAENSNV